MCHSILVRATLILTLILNLTSIANAGDATQDLAQDMRQHDFRLAPVALLLGELVATVDFKVAPPLTLGPEVVAYNVTYNGYNAASYALGLRANYKLTGSAFTNGFYLGPYLRYYSINISNYGNFGAAASTTGALAGLVLGYQWLWKVGFNVNVGAGLEVASFSHVHVTDGQGNSNDVAIPLWGSGFVGEVALGWLF